MNNTNDLKIINNFLEKEMFIDLILGEGKIDLKDSFWNTYNYSSALLYIFKYLNENNNSFSRNKFLNAIETISKSKKVNSIDHGLLSLHILKEIKILDKYFPELRIQEIISDVFLANIIYSIAKELTDKEKKEVFYDRDYNDLKNYIPNLIPMVSL